MLKRKLPLTASLAVPLFAALPVLLSACATAPGNYLDTSRLHEDAPTQPAPTYQVHTIDAALVRNEAMAAAAVPQMLPVSAFGSPAQYVYRLAPQDIVGVTVYDHPEISTPSGTTFSTGNNTTQSFAQTLTQPYTNALPGQADPYGQTIDANGDIYFPYVGHLRAAGKTPTQLRDEMARRLAPYIKDPQVDVRVLAYRGQKVQVTGDVKTPGPLSVSDVPLTLVDAITRSGGSTADADLARVQLTRNGKLYTMDAYRMLNHGDATQDVLLQNGDVVNVPDRSDSRVFVMGEVKMPMPMPMHDGRLTIADAITNAQGILDTDANPRQVYVMRGAQLDPAHPEIFHLDMTQPDAMVLSTQFQLKPFDVVYVGTAASTTFNRVLQQVLPTIQTVFYLKQITN